MQCSVLLYGAPPPPQCSYCSRHRLSGRRSYLHPQFTAQLVGACSYWHLGTENVFLWPCAYYYYFLRLKFLTTKFLTGDAVCSMRRRGGGGWGRCRTFYLRSIFLFSRPRAGLATSSFSGLATITLSSFRFFIVEWHFFLFEMNDKNTENCIISLPTDEHQLFDTSC